MMTAHQQPSPPTPPCNRREHELPRRQTDGGGQPRPAIHQRVRVKIMGSQKYENVGESQPLLIMNDPMIST
eukprot:COSAG01_NODE_12702_length_1697_cov_3.008761_1_plen_70_part_10